MRGGREDGRGGAGVFIERGIGCAEGTEAPERQADVAVELLPGEGSFLDELMWIHPPVAVVPATGTPHQQTEELCAALELIQLMEDVFMDLQLDDFWEHPDNRGWAILFMRWARSQLFRRYWSQTHRTLGLRFEYFCAARLGLTRDEPIVRV